MCGKRCRTLYRIFTIVCTLTYGAHVKREDLPRTPCSMAWHSESDEAQKIEDSLLYVRNRTDRQRGSGTMAMFMDSGNLSGCRAGVVKTSLVSKSVDGDRAEIKVSSTRTTHSLKTISSPLSPAMQGYFFCDGQLQHNSLPRAAGTSLGGRVLSPVSVV